MSINRSTRAGLPIKLRARFKDDLDDVAQASNVYVHLYEPETSDFSLINAYTVSGVPSYLGEGIYEYEFTPPDIDGTWYDRWTGILTSQSLQSTFSFEVSASGIITSLPETQLWENNLIKVTVSSGIQATDGTSLSSDYEFEFMTTANPAYTNIRKILLVAGSYLTGVEDDAIQTAILEASIEADTLTWTSNIGNLAIFRHARREYVTCLASSILLNNLASGSLRSKSLGDLRVEYDTNGLRDMLRGFEGCLEKWQPQILAGGNAKVAASPQRVIKGSLDPDRPSISRMWQSTSEGGASRRIPAANYRERNEGQRRHLRIFKRRWW